MLSENERLERWKSKSGTEFTDAEFQALRQVDIECYHQKLSDLYNPPKKAAAQADKPAVPATEPPITRAEVELMLKRQAKALIKSIGGVMREDVFTRIKSMEERLEALENHSEAQANSADALRRQFDALDIKILATTANSRRGIQ